MNKNIAVLNSAAEYPKHRAADATRKRMRCEGTPRTQDFRWLLQPGFGDGGGQQQRGVFRDGTV